MSIRLTRAVLTDGRIDIEAWQEAVRASIAVGYCDCASPWPPASGERITIGRKLTWATAVCVRCGDNAALPVVRDVPAERLTGTSRAGEHPRRPVDRSDEMRPDTAGQRRPRRARQRLR